MRRLNIIIAICLLVSIVWSCINLKYLQEKRIEIDRLRNNIFALNKDIEQRTFRDSLRCAEVEALTLKVEDLESLRQADFETIKELRLRPKDVVTIERVKTITKDSVIFRYKDSCITYSDRWININACLNSETLNYSVCDSLQTFISVSYRKRFLWWRWKPYYKVNVISANPRTTIIAAEAILLE